MKSLTGIRNGAERPQRWGGQSTFASLNLPTCIEANMTPEQTEAYSLIFRIDEINHRLRSNDVLPTHRCRSPSPSPQNDGSGRRTNTRVQRHRRALETTRYELIQEALATIPDYNPPLDYRPPTKFTDKLHIPIDEYPDINFLGQLFGARGRSIQALKDHSGANISVRGRGSVKPGKNKSQDCFATSTEPLHCLIIADSADKLRKAQDLVQSVIDNAIATCGGYNARKTQQLRDLAIMNGTFRDDENHVAPIHTTIEQPTRLLESHSTKHREIEDFDFNREYDLLLEDIGANQHVEKRAKVPPWRLNRLSREK